MSLRSGSDILSVCKGSTKFLTTVAACQLAWVAEPFPFVNGLALSQCLRHELPWSQCLCTATEKIGMEPLKWIQLLCFFS